MSDTNPMFFSFVIPLYNKAEYVSKTLSSVLAQTYPHFEVIVVNDGSTDNSLDVARTFTDDRIKIITQSNKGASAARNMGINAAKYELIALLDADDWLDKSFLEEMLVLIKEYPDVSLYTSQFGDIRNHKILPRKKIFKNNFKNTGCFNLFQMALELKIPSTYCIGVVIRKSILQKSGFFDEQITHGEDTDFFIRIGMYSKVAYIEKGPLAFYNHDVDVKKRASGNVPPIKKHLFNYFGKYTAYYKEYPRLEAFINKYILDGLYVYNHLENYSEIKKLMLKNISIKQYSFKHLLKYYIPTAVLDYIVTVYRKIKGIHLNRLYS